MKQAVFVVDVPGWSLDEFAQRVSRHLSLSTQIHYLYPSIAAISTRDPDLRLPPAKAYYCTSWWFMWLLVQSGKLGRSSAYLIDVVDDYSWKSPKFGAAKERADVVLTQSLPYLHSDPTAVFHPFPASPTTFSAPRTVRRNRNRLKVGMVANGSAHSGEDHKGVALARQVIQTLPWCDLEVAGTDRMYTQQQMPAWYQTLDIFLCLSKSEGFSSVIVDAITSGLPIVGTPVAPLVPFLRSRYTPVTRDAATLRAVLTRSFNLLKGGKTLPTAFDAVLAWSEDQVAKTLEPLIRGAMK